MRRLLLILLLAAAMVSMLADATPTTATAPKSGGSDATLPPATPVPKSDLSREQRRHQLRHRELAIDNSSWAWVPLVVVGVFMMFLLSGTKFGKERQSLRAIIARYVALETVLNTLQNADAHTAQEQKYIEKGHLFFEFLVVVMITANFFFGNGAVQPVAFLYLITVQMILLWLELILDNVLIRVDRFRIVRSANAKVRISQISYQALLFCVDSISAAGLTTLPISCFHVAIASLACESVGLIFEGLAMIGCTELIVVALVCQHSLASDNNTTGAVAAFGLSCLALSCATVFFSMIWKIVAAVREGPDVFEEGDDEHGHGHGHGHGAKAAHGHGGGKKSAPSSLASLHSSPHSASASTAAGSNHHGDNSGVAAGRRTSTGAAVGMSVATLSSHSVATSAPLTPPQHGGNDSKMPISPLLRAASSPTSPPPERKKKSAVHPPPLPERKDDASSNSNSAEGTPSGVNSNQQQ